jgi:hypothetical protein
MSKETNGMHGRRVRRVKAVTNVEELKRPYQLCSLTARHTHLRVTDPPQVLINQILGGGWRLRHEEVAVVRRGGGGSGEMAREGSGPSAVEGGRWS